jgi:hypothetical protein
MKMPLLYIIPLLTRKTYKIPQFLQANTGIIPPLGYGCFLPNPS